MNYVYDALISTGVFLVMLGVLILVLRRAVRPLLGPLQAMRVTMLRPTVIHSEVTPVPPLTERSIDPD